MAGEAHLWPDEEILDLSIMYEQKRKKIDKMISLWETSKSEAGIGRAEKIFAGLRKDNEKMILLVGDLLRRRKTDRLLLQLYGVTVSQNTHLKEEENWVGKLSDDIRNHGIFYRLLMGEKERYEEIANQHVVIIGAGIAGLSTAYHLLEKGIKPIVIEKDTVGSGATSKSSGLLCSIPEWDLKELIEKVGDIKEALEIWKINLYAVRLLMEFISKNNIDCGLRELNSVYLCLEEEDVEYLKEEAEARRAQGFKAEILDKEGLRRVINTDKFYAGLYAYNDHIIKSELFIRQLGDLLRRWGVRIVEGTKAVKVDKKRRVVVTNKGRIRYGKLVLATNYHVMELGFFRNTIAPLRVYTADSHPLPPEVLNRIGWKGREALWDNDFFYTYFYLSPNNSIHIGGGVDRIAVSEREASARMMNRAKRYFEEYLDSVFPGSAIKMMEIASGVFGMSLDELPIIGRLKGEKDIYFNISSPGLAFSFLGGKIIADIITMGEHRLEEMFDPNRDKGWLFRHTRFLPKKFFRMGAHAYLRFK